MKKSLLLSLAFMATAAYAQENLALGGTATATATADNENAAKAIDNDPGTRWEAPAASFAESEAATWTLDLGEAKEFNTVQILWEGAYSKSFTISVSADGETYDEVVSVTGQSLGDMLQNYSFDAVTARYIKFDNVERATIWGVSFFEFRVFKLDASVLTTLELSADNKFTTLATPVAFTATGKDQVGQAMSPGDVSYTVTPAEAGTIADGIFTPAQTGAAVITATAGDVTAKYKIYVLGEDDLPAAPANVQRAIYPAGEDGTTYWLTVYNGGAVRGNEMTLGTQKVMPFSDFACAFFSPEAGEKWDGLDYDPAALGYASLKADVFATEGCKMRIMIEDKVSGNGNTDVAFDLHEGWNTLEAELSDVKNISNMSLRSENADTKLDVLVTNLYFTKTGIDENDHTAPADFTATAAAAAYNSITLKLQATDETSRTVSYAISYAEKGSEAEPQTAAVSGISGAEVNYEIKGLEPSMTYAISVTAKDANGNATEPLAFEASTKAYATPAPAAAPTLASNMVTSVYSDAYPTAEGLNVQFMDWAGNTPSFDEVELAEGDKAERIIGLSNIFGIDLGTTIDVSECVKLHLDIWADEAQSLKVSPICGETQDAPQEFSLAEGWNHVAYDLLNPEAAQLPLDRTYQIELKDGNGHSLIYVDNIYFERAEPGVEPDVTAPVFAESYPKAEATESTVTITLKATDDRAENIYYTVKYGEAEGQSKTASAANGEETSITFEGLEDGTAYAFSIVATDGKNPTEAQVLNVTTVALPAVTVSTDLKALQTGASATLIAYDKHGNRLSEGVVWTTESELGTIEDNVFTAGNAAGILTIKATYGDASDELEIAIFDAAKIAIAMANVTPDEGTLTEGMENAFDADGGSLWALHGDDENRDVTVGFTADLGADYLVDALSVSFEGACPADCTITLLDADKQPVAAPHAVAGHAGGPAMNFTDSYLCPAEGVRYVRFESTKSATVWGVKIMDFSIYGALPIPEGIGHVGTDGTDAATYDLAGRRVSGKAKGIVIRNGKKVLVK